MKLLKNHYFFRPIRFLPCFSPNLTFDYLFILGITLFAWWDAGTLLDPGSGGYSPASFGNSPGSLCRQITKIKKHIDENDSPLLCGCITSSHRCNTCYLHTHTYVGNCIHTPTQFQKIYSLHFLNLLFLDFLIYPLFSIPPLKKKILSIIFYTSFFLFFFPLFSIPPFS